jgi:hypothetical protein
LLISDADRQNLAPECYDDIIAPESDVFSFGLILYALIVGRPVIPKTPTLHLIEGIFVLKERIAIERYL